MSIKNNVFTVYCTYITSSLCVKVQEMSWSSVAGWTGQGGSVLGTKRLVNGACILLLVVVVLVVELIVVV